MISLLWLSKTYQICREGDSMGNFEKSVLESAIFPFFENYYSYQKSHGKWILSSDFLKQKSMVSIFEAKNEKRDKTKIWYRRTWFLLWFTESEGNKRIRCTIIILKLV